LYPNLGFNCNSSAHQPILQKNTSMSTCPRHIPSFQCRQATMLFRLFQVSSCPCPSMLSRCSLFVSVRISTSREMLILHGVPLNSDQTASLKFDNLTEKAQNGPKQKKLPSLSDGRVSKTPTCMNNKHSSTRLFHTTWDLGIERISTSAFIHIFFHR